LDNPWNLYWRLCADRHLLRGSPLPVDLHRCDALPFPGALPSNPMFVLGWVKNCWIHKTDGLMPIINLMGPYPKNLTCRTYCKYL
jgi:hypothetical protein